MLSAIKGRTEHMLADCAMLMGRPRATRKASREGQLCRKAALKRDCNAFIAKAPTNPHFPAIPCTHPRLCQQAGCQRTLKNLPSTSRANLSSCCIALTRIKTEGTHSRCCHALLCTTAVQPEKPHLRLCLKWQSFSSITQRSNP